MVKALSFVQTANHPEQFMEFGQIKLKINDSQNIQTLIPHLHPGISKWAWQRSRKDDSISILELSVGLLSYMMTVNCLE